MQKTISKVIDCPQNDSTECDSYEGVQTLIGIDENNLVEVSFTRERLMENIFSSNNLNTAYLSVKRNGGASGVDKMDVQELLPYLREHKDTLINSLMDGSYRPNPVLRVEIPKDNGTMRQLGIPTVIDRVIQQAISQFLTTIYDIKFNSNSYGFRPRRNAHQALRKVQSYASAGYEYAVDLDLEKFFDTVNHSKLIELLSRTIKDGRLLSLIHKYMRSGVVIGTKYEATLLGVPQGSPLSPLLSNIMLNELDKELSTRNHPFVRYADDCMIFCKSTRSAHRTQESITRFIESKLLLKVNKAKTKIGSISGMKFLGYSFYKRKGDWRLTVHPKSFQKMKSRLKELTSRNNGWSYERRKFKLKEFINGWIGYFKCADMKGYLLKIDQWLRRRIRMCIWKAWKLPKTKLKNLVKCGIDHFQAKRWASTRKSYWHTSRSWILSISLDNTKLRKAGYPTLTDCYRECYRR